MNLAILAYDALGTLGAVLAAPLLPLLAASRHGAGLAERLGELPSAARAAAIARPIWVHAASVGEVLAASPLIDALRVRHPERPILLSTTSVTGREAARGLRGVAVAMLLPVDLRWIARVAVRAIAPSALIIVETEIWPALFDAAGAAGVPIAVVSGRVSARAARRYALVRPVLRATLQRVSVFAMQTDADAERVRGLGAAAERVHVTGSLKYARGAAPPAPSAAHGLGDVNGRRVLIAASTQPSEEAVVLEACAGLWPSYPDCLLVLAPRRPERFDEVDALLAQWGLRRERRSLVSGTVKPDTQVLLLDSVGELPGLLGRARAVFVGGTIAPLGGHNILEPAAAGTPVCFGPHTENVAEAAAALLEGGGGVRVRSAEELRAVWLSALAEPQAARAMGVRGLQVVQARAAVVGRTLALLEPVLR